MSRFEHILTERVLNDIENLREEGLKKKIKLYCGLLDEHGYNLPQQYMDKIEGYKGLLELRPHFHNIEFRMAFFWRGNTAVIIHTFYERGSRKKNQREYETAETIRKALTGGG